MNEQKSNASDKNVLAPIVSEGHSNSNKSDEHDENSGKKLLRWEWRKILRTVRDVSSVASVLISLVKILEDLGLLP